MPRILLVKTSSLGDVVHNLPVASDIAQALPGWTIDWVVEESFSAIPRLHPDVTRVIPIALRRWRRAWLKPETWREIGRMGETLRVSRYDAIVDTQGLLKSAFVARCANGRRYGLDWRSSREPLGAFYHRTFRVPRSAPAVERNRTLAASALRYVPPAEVNYGLRSNGARPVWMRDPAYAVLVHATSARAKLWPESHWVDLAMALHERGIAAVFPWGNAAERERSGRLAHVVPRAVAAPQLSLEEVAALFAHAQCAVGVDTGLTHLAGALGTPTVGIYSATEPALTGLYGCERAVNIGGRGEMPEVADVLNALDGLIR